MSDPYTMVIASIISSLALLFGLFIYRFVFPKRNISFFILIFLVSLLPIISIFRNGSYESGDFAAHVYRSIEFYSSLSEGHILPSWAGNLNATYGYPLFIFNYPLPYYFICLFHFFGFTFITSMKLFLATNFLASGIFMFLAMKKLFKNDFIAFVSSLFYQFAPYHLVDLHFKVVIGELMVFTFLPCVFYCLQKTWERKNTLWFSITSLSVALLIMSHVVLAFFGLIILFLYSLLIWQQSRKQSVIFLTFGSFLIGSISSMYIWLTPFFLIQYTIFSKMTTFVASPQLWELLFSPWRMGLLFQGHKGEISNLIGYAQFLVVIIIFIALWLKKKLVNKTQILFWLVTFFVLVFLISPYSRFLWSSVSFLKSAGGSHRLLLPTVFVVSILAGYLSCIMIKKRKLLWLLILFTLFSTILNWGHRRLLPQITDQTLKETLWKSTSGVEGHWYAISKWRDVKHPYFLALPKSHLEILKGSGEIQEIQRSSTKHTYVISAKDKLQMRENTMYFPGWNVFVDKKLVNAGPDKDGIITFSVPPKLHYVEVSYQDIFIYKLLKTISVVGLIVVCSYCVYKLLRKTQR